MKWMRRNSMEFHINEDHPWYKLFESIDDFKQDFPKELAFLYENGYRVSYFGDYTLAYYYSTSDDDPISGLSPRGKIWVKAHGIEPEMYFQCPPCEGKVRCTGIIPFISKCPVYIVHREQIEREFAMKLCSRDVEDDFVKMVQQLNQSRPKGTQFSTIYEIDAERNPRGTGGIHNNIVKWPNTTLYPEHDEAFPHYSKYIHAIMSVTKDASEE